MPAGAPRKKNTFQGEAMRIDVACALKQSCWRAPVLSSRIRHGTDHLHSPPGRGPHPAAYAPGLLSYRHQCLFLRHGHGLRLLGRPHPGHQGRPADERRGPGQRPAGRPSGRDALHRAHGLAHRPLPQPPRHHAGAHAHALRPALPGPGRQPALAGRGPAGFRLCQQHAQHLPQCPGRGRGDPLRPQHHGHLPRHVEPWRGGRLHHRLHRGAAGRGAPAPLCRHPRHHAGDAVLPAHLDHAPGSAHRRRSARKREALLPPRPLSDPARLHRPGQHGHGRRYV